MMELAEILQKYQHIAGVDEVGRGPLVGAVVTAAVILDPNNPIEGLNDSKKLTEKKREKLFSDLKEKIIYPKAETNALVVAMGSTPLLKPATAEEFLRRPEINFNNLAAFGFGFDQDEVVTEAVEIQVKYSGYVKRQYEIIEQSKKMES